MKSLIKETHILLRSTRLSILLRDTNTLVLIGLELTSFHLWVLLCSAKPHNFKNLSSTYMWSAAGVSYSLPILSVILAEKGTIFFTDFVLKMFCTSVLLLSCDVRWVWIETLQLTAQHWENKCFSMNPVSILTFKTTAAKNPCCKRCPGMANAWPRSTPFFE